MDWALDDKTVDFRLPERRIRSGSLIVEPDCCQNPSLKISSEKEKRLTENQNLHQRDDDTEDQY